VTWFGMSVMGVSVGVGKEERKEGSSVILQEARIRKKEEKKEEACRERQGKEEKEGRNEGRVVGSS